jgi:hypothetical protein
MFTEHFKAKLPGLQIINNKRWSRSIWKKFSGFLFGAVLHGMAKVLAKHQGFYNGLTLVSSGL